MIEFLENAVRVGWPLVVAVVGWFALNMLAKAILALRDARFKALQLAERYAHFDALGSTDETYINAVRRKIFDAGSDLRTHARAHSKAVNLYCKLMGYDLEEAASALIGIGRMVGIAYDTPTRRNTLTHVHVSLG